MQFRVHYFKIGLCTFYVVNLYDSFVSSLEYVIFGIQYLNQLTCKFFFNPTSVKLTIYAQFVGVCNFLFISLTVVLVLPCIHLLVDGYLSREHTFYGCALAKYLINRRHGLRWSCRCRHNASSGRQLETTSKPMQPPSKFDGT